MPRSDEALIQHRCVAAESAVWLDLSLDGPRRMKRVSPLASSTPSLTATTNRRGALHLVQHPTAGILQVRQQFAF